MSRRSSPCIELALAAALLFVPSAAYAQACCAGSGAITPGRLILHEDELAGVTVRAADAFGSLDGRGHYATQAPGASEYDLEEDVFGAIRFLDRGQGAVLVPIVETRRQVRSVGSELGGGFGDLNLAGRWDFVLAGESKRIPGIGVLAGVTFPTGTAPEGAHTPLATGATGIGAFQGNVGLALEQTFGHWLVNATGLLAKRLPRTVQGTHSVLGTQVTLLAATGYAFDNDASVAGLLSYSFEGDATVGGADVTDSGRRLLRASLAGSLPVTDRIRLQGTIFFDPPILHVDQNQLTEVGLSFGGILSWS